MCIRDRDKDAFTFNEETISEEEVPDAEFDAPLAKQLFFVRSQIFEMLTDTKMSLEDKLILLLEVCHQLQEAVNVNDTAACDRIAQSSYTEWGKFTDTDTPKQQEDRQANVPQTAQSDSAVSYTHLDVYKRQVSGTADCIRRGCGGSFIIKIYQRWRQRNQRCYC